MINYVFIFSLLAVINPVSLKATDRMKVYYDVNFQRDTNNSASMAEERMELMIAGQQSYFISSKLSILDSIRHFNMDEGRYERGSTVPRLKIFKDFDVGLIHYHETFFHKEGGTFTYEEPMDMLDWEMLHDTMTFNGMLCQKAKVAFGNRTWYAWFCPEIPIPDGPYKFCGLPGLIVRMSDATNTWSFEMAGMVNVRGLMLDFPYLKKSVKMNKDDFYQERKDFMDSYLERQIAAGVLSFPDKSAQQKMIQNSRENAKKNNNWIELYP